LSPGETVMVGDREHDVLAGKANGTRTIAVTYGYGSAHELKQASPDCICDSPAEVTHTAQAMAAL
jgi:phosphoglycolate phosphatase